MTHGNWRVVLIALSLCVGVSARAGQVMIAASNPSPNVGDKFYVTVKGIDMPKNGGGSLGLAWDNAVVTVAGVVLAPGSPFDFVSMNAPTYNPFTFARNTGNVCDPNPCSFDAVRIIFKAVGPGKANIVINDDGTGFGWSNPDDPNFGMLPKMAYSQASVVVGTGPAAAPDDTADSTAQAEPPVINDVPAVTVQKTVGDQPRRSGNGALFSVLAILFALAGSLLGSALSKTVAYPAPLSVALIFAMGWGVFVAFVIYELVSWQEPGGSLRWLGYGLGAVAAIANIRWVNSAAPSDPATRRNILVAVISLIFYVGASALALNAT
jgi:hypothetical protein